MSNKLNFEDVKREIKRKSLLTIIRNNRKGKAPYCLTIECRDCFYGREGMDNYTYCSEISSVLDYEQEYIKAYGEDSLIEELL